MNRWIELTGTFRRSEQASAAAPRKRAGFGGEKAAVSAASLPVPGNLNISLILRKLSRLYQCSASGSSPTVE